MPITMMQRMAMSVCWNFLVDQARPADAGDAVDGLGGDDRRPREADGEADAR